MFDKNKFAQVIKNIKETYISQEDFSKKSGIGRTYLSQYMNMKLDEPPKPKILEKLANASNGIISYQELMEICGYSSAIINEISKSNFKKISNDLSSIGLSHFQINELYTLLTDCYNDSIFKEKLSSFMDTLSVQKIAEIYIIIEKFFEMQSVSYTNYKGLLDNEIKKRANLNTNKSRYYMTPVYGQISAGQPNWAEENIEGRIPIDTNLMDIVNPEEHFFLRVNGESMNKVVKNGAFALIHKQDSVENGEIAVVLVNGFDATLKKFTKKGDIVVLEPDSDVTDDPDIKTQIYDKTTPIKILGKYVGKMEINK